MPQLVGLECGVCRARIASVLDGEFCAACGSPVHKRCATPRVAKSGACEVCGADAKAGAAHRERSREEAARHARHSRRFRLLAGLLWLGVGLTILTVGLASLVRAASSDAGRSPLWIGGIILGAILTARGLGHLHALWRMRRKTGREPTIVHAADAER